MALAHLYAFLAYLIPFIGPKKNSEEQLNFKSFWEIGGQNDPNRPQNRVGKHMHAPQGPGSFLHKYVLNQFWTHSGSKSDREGGFYYFCRPGSCRGPWTGPRTQAGHRNPRGRTITAGRQATEPPGRGGGGGSNTTLARATRAVAT